MAGQRVLGRIRLSRFTEESTSVERQREIIEAYVKAQDDILVGWATDIDVSRSVDPFDTPELGQWFKEEKIEDWDKVACWRLDRLATGSIYLNKVIGWCQENNKILVSVTESFDLSNWVGRMVANVIAGVAEGELEAIKERTKGSYKKLLESGRWPGGTPPYGHIPAKINTGGWVLVADGPAVEVIDRMTDMAIAGNSIDWIRDELTAEGVPTPIDRWLELKGLPTKGGPWNSKAIWNTLTNKSLLGHATRDRETVRDTEGRAVLYGEPILTRERWDLLQEALDKRRNGPRRTRNTGPLLGVAYCPDCASSLMHKAMQRNYGKGMYRYYHCANRDCAFDVMMEAETVELLLEQHFIEDLGDEPEQKRIFVRGSDHTEELKEAREAVEEITSMWMTAKSKSVRDRLKEQMNSLDTRIESLEQLPVRESGYKYEDTGRTYGEAWMDCHSPEERRQLLLKYGITAVVKQTDRTRQGPGVFKFDLRVPPDLVRRMAQ